MRYGMFVAIVVPQAKEEKPILASVLLAVAFSSLFRWMPVLNRVDSGLSIVICTIAAAVLCAVMFPIKDEEGKQS